jgi:hypothetical protein
MVQIWGAQPMMPLLPTVLPPPVGQEPRRFDIRGFLVGIVLSAVIGAVLYIFLIAR